MGLMAHRKNISRDRLPIAILLSLARHNLPKSLPRFSTGGTIIIAIKTLPSDLIVDSISALQLEAASSLQL
jgi:hypothetical protein